MKKIILLIMLNGSFAHALDVKLNLDVKDANDCGEEIVGLIEGEKITLSADVSGAKGKLRYRFWHTNAGFEIRPLEKDEQTQDITDKNTRKNKTKFEIPMLRSDMSRANIVLGVSVLDSKGNSGSDIIRMRVTRPLVFVSQENKGAACYQTYMPSCVSGQYINQNDTNTSISVSYATQRIRTETDTRGSSWSFSPSLFVGELLLSFFGYQRTHMNALAYQTIEGLYVQSSHELNPGDVGELYEQKTRLLYPYEVYHLDSCRNEVYTGEAYLEVWRKNYDLIKKNPLESSVCNTSEYGMELVNTCKNLEATVESFTFSGE